MRKAVRFGPLFCVMMKRIIFRTLALLLVWGIALSPLSVSAQSFSFADLSSCGISSMRVARPDSAVCDGVLSSEEYLHSVQFRKNAGLYLMSNTSDTASSDLSDEFCQENFVSLVGDLIYCGIRLSVKNEDLSPIVKSDVSCYRISVSLGLFSGDHPALLGSLLTNTYYFSSSDFSCVGFTGQRTARSVEERSSASKPMSTFVASQQNSGVTTSDGVKWNAGHYCEEAFLSLEKGTSITQIVAEFRIPVEDALLSVTPSQRNSVRTQLRNPNQTLWGSFTTKVDLNSRSYLITGLPASEPASFSSDYESFFDWMDLNFEVPVSGKYIPSVIPIPLYWCGDIPKTSVTAVPSPHENVGAGSAPDLTTTHAEIPQAVTTTSAPLETKEYSSLHTKEDESVFASLPDRDDLLPEDTEIVYDEKSTTKKKENQTSLASSILATATGVLILVSVLVLCIYFRAVEKKLEAETTQNRKQNKKNKQKKPPEKKS